MRTALVATFLLLCLGLAPAADATTPDEICSGNPCVVLKNTTRNVTPGSVLDFGNRDLQLMGGAKLVVGAGSMVIKVRNLTLEPASGLLGAGGMIEVDATGTINVRRDGTSISRIDTAGDAAGSISLNAMGNVVIEGVLDASSTAVDQFAGDIAVIGASIVIPGEIDIHGGRAGSPGTLELDAAANLSLSGTIDSSGGDADVEGITLTAGGAVTTTGKIDLSATVGGGFGGALEIDADGSVALGGNINVRGESSGEDVGDAGDITVNSGDSIQISAFLQMTGVPADGAGGSAEFTAEHDITQSVAIDASGNGQQSQGGSLAFEAHRNLTLGSIDVHGGADGFGGSVDATAWCSLTLPAAARLDASGLGGTNSLASGGALTVAGTMIAGSDNFIQYRSASDPISITGSITPNSPAEINPNLTPCGGFPPPPDCGNGKLDQGEVCDGNLGTCPQNQACSSNCSCQTVPRCGDGTKDPGEACDDGNTVSCDGCKGDCSRLDNVCGDGIVECGEQDDKGDANSCDGISSTCQIETCGNGVQDCNEDCDDGSANGTQGDPCTAQCTLVAPLPCVCGNGTIQAECGEQCDDLNQTDGDGCSSTCKIEVCGNGAVDPEDECDDGAQNGVLGDPCSATCTLHWCGDGIRDSDPSGAGEACDDANTDECDTCHSDCTTVVGKCPLCVTGGETDPDRCTRCITAVDCDPLGLCGPSACVAGVCTPTNPPSCDDGIPCTTDVCNPASGCTHAPKVFDDGNACNGTETCDPASGQSAVGPAPTCDDGDACTDGDHCEPDGTGFHCTTSTRVGEPGVECRLATIEQLLNGASDLKKASKKKMGKVVKQVRSKLAAVSGTGKKAVKARKFVNSHLQSLMKLLAKANPGATTASDLRDAIAKTMTAVAGL
jgi:cysteine-rich repeat protein